MTNTTLGLLRHGQTDWNINFLLQGVTDIPMNEKGILQATAAAEVILPADWDVLLTSPLSRARKTAEIVASKGGFRAVIVEELLLERSFGEAEGLSHEQWREKYRDLDKIPGGESVSELLERGKRLLEVILEKYSGLSILAVSHGALIRKLVEIGSQGELPREGERFDNASLNTLSHRGKSWEVTRYDIKPLA